MHFKADNVVTDRGEDRTEEGLDQDGVILQNFLYFLHLGAALFNIQSRFRIGQGGIPLRVGIAGFVPRYPGTVSQAKYHDG